MTDRENALSWQGQSVAEMSDVPIESKEHHLVPSRVLSIYQRHNWHPISGQFWSCDDGVVSCCGAAAVALHIMPDLINKVITSLGDTQRVSPALLAVSAAIHAPLTYTWDFTLGFDRGFDEAIKGTVPGITDDELDMRRRTKIFGIEDGLRSGRLVGFWWKRKLAGADK